MAKAPLRGRSGMRFPKIGETAAKLVSQFRSSHHCAEASFANFGIEGH